ncbi:MAG: outer membrane lipoprotein-sorting protein [Candidatus Kapabacteria bacterium]|nr:outer membrane lipoprotein-sorting protein [Candidatus Kapabacteria bacterium]
MKNKWFYSLIIVAFAFLINSCSKSPEEIIDKSVKASGGVEAYKSLKTISCSMKTTVLNFELLSNLFFKLPDKMRAEYMFQDKKGIGIINGNSGWSYSNDTLITLDETAYNSLKSQMESQLEFFINPLYNYQKKGLKVEYVGDEKVDGKDVHKIRTIAKDSSEVYYFIDKNTYLIQRTNSKTLVNNVFVEATAVFSNYKKFNGLLIPEVIGIYTEGKKTAEMKFERIDINTNLDDNLFSISGFQQ